MLSYILFILGFHFGFSSPVSVSPNILTKDQTCILSVARSKLGVRETSNNRGPEVDKIIIAGGGKPGQAWCGWFARFCHMVGCKIKPVGGGMAMSWFVKDNIVKDPDVRPGDVFSVWNKYMKRIGHVGMVEMVKDDKVITIEGNTNGFGQREGSGVCRLTRSKKSIYSFARWWRK